MIVDIRPYHNQVTSYMLFTSNYLLFIFNLLAPTDFILNTHKTALITTQLLHQARLQKNGWNSPQLIHHPQSRLSEHDAIQDRRWLMFQHFQKEQLCVLGSRKYDKVDIFYSKSSKYVLCQFQYDWLLICRYLVAKFNGICKFNVK